MKIVILEPTWDGLAHCPVNLGVIRTIRSAYPDAFITFIAGERHINEIKKISIGNEHENVAFLNYHPKIDRDTLPTDILATYKQFKQLPTNILNDADLIIQTSCTASSLACSNWMGFSHKTITYLHGNANEINAWRSNNPVRHFLDFTSSLKTFGKKNGKILVYESGIKNRLIEKAPWLKNHIHVLGHSILAEERDICKTDRLIGQPVKIGFAGNATISKGFPEFVKLAKILHETNQGKFEFYAFSYLHPSCKEIDQSCLKKQAKDGLPRDEFIRGLDSMDFIFAWHNADYYTCAASGILYDAINLGIPLIARRTPQIQFFEDHDMPVALHFESLEEVATALTTQQPHQRNYQNLISGMKKARNSLTPERLALEIRKILAISSQKR